MLMLESIGLEMVIRPQTRECMTNPHTLGLSKGRFWSSSDQLPATRIIARVLADPVEPDLVKLKQHFGIGLILATWKRLIQRGDVPESVVPITKMMLRKLVTAS